MKGSSSHHKSRKTLDREFPNAFDPIIEAHVLGLDIFVVKENFVWENVQCHALSSGFLYPKSVWICFMVWTKKNQALRQPFNNLPLSSQ